MFALSLAVNEIFANQETIQNFDLENDRQGQGVEKQDLGHPTRNVRFHADAISEF